MTDPAPTLIPVVMCGGPGTRLWPLSREMVPKPFAELPHGGTLIGELLQSLGPLDCPLVVYVAAAQHVAACQAAHAAAGLSCEAAVIAEPMARNTGAAIAAATGFIQARVGQEAVLAVLPADHLIADRARFNAALALAAAGPARDHLVTLGITPTGPATGYGYVQAQPGTGDWRPVERFIEKPDAERAAALLAAGDHYWNAGVFVATAGVFAAELTAHQPALAELATAVGQVPVAGGVAAVPADLYAGIEGISFDYAVMEKSARVAIVPVADAGWSDVGTWDEFRQLLPAAAAGNRATGDTVLVDTTDSSVHARGGRLVALVGCTGLNVVDTPDALLVSATGTAAGMRELNQRLAGDGRLTYPPAERRPWGRYDQLGTGTGWKAKRIEVEPGKRLSLQSHEHRAEHWIVVAGVMTVTIGDEVTQVPAGQACHVPLGAKHRMANEGDGPAVLIEVQCGTYLGEDDIQRYEDDFGRS